MDRLGLGYQALSAVKPRLIYCAVSGFGQTGPERTTAASTATPGDVGDHVDHRRSRRAARPAPGSRICDTIGRHDGGLAVASALYQRTHTGRGQLVDVDDGSMRRLASSRHGLRVHRRGHRGAADRQRLGEPQADREPVPGARRLHRAGGAHREAVRESDEDARHADALADHVSRTGPRAPPTSRRCARSSSRRWRPTIPRAGRRVSPPRTCRAAPSGRSTRSSSIRSSSTGDVLQTIDSRYGPMRLVGAGFRLDHGSPDSTGSRRPSASTPTKS